MIRYYFPLWFTVMVCAFFLSQLVMTPTAAESTRTINTGTTSEDILEARPIAPGERTVVSVHTTGRVEVALVEASVLQPEEEQMLAKGETPRGARVFDNVKTLVYPLASQTGTTFHLRVRHRVAGETTVTYTPGTAEAAMALLRKGENLLRNQGTLQVEGLYTLPVYQLVPETIVKVEIQKGKGMVALLKTLDYLSVKDGEAKLSDLCGANPCATNSHPVVEIKLEDYEDRYLVVQSEDGTVEFTYWVIATPGVLDYITTCG